MKWFSTNISPQSLLRIPQGDSCLIRSDLFCIGMTSLCANRLCVFSRQKRSSRKLRKCLKSSTLTYKKNYHRCGQGKHASAPVCTSHLQQSKRSDFPRVTFLVYNASVLSGSSLCMLSNMETTCHIYLMNSLDMVGETEEQNFIFIFLYLTLINLLEKVYIC